MSTTKKDKDKLVTITGNLGTKFNHSEKDQKTSIRFSLAAKGKEGKPEWKKISAFMGDAETMKELHEAKIKAKDKNEHHVKTVTVRGYMGEYNGEQQLRVKSGEVYTHEKVSIEFQALKVEDKTTNSNHELYEIFGVKEQVVDNISQKENINLEIYKNTAKLHDVNIKEKEKLAFFGDKKTRIINANGEIKRFTIYRAWHVAPDLEKLKSAVQKQSNAINSRVSEENTETKNKSATKKQTKSKDKSPAI